MRKSSFIALLLGLLWVHTSIFAYDIPNHFDMSFAAVGKSVLGEELSALTRLGLQNIDQEFPATPGEDSREFVDDCKHGKQFSIAFLIACGAQFEDVPGTRSFNHFFDPTNNGPLKVHFPAPFGPMVEPGSLLGVPNLTSPDWALQDNNVDSQQQFSYRRAREYFMQALTRPGPQSERDAQWGMLFQSLGQVIHHMQDMAQPQHVRNDQHVDKFVPFFYNPSLFERYTSDLKNRPAIQVFLGAPGADAIYSASNPGAYKLPRDFWINTSGTGLAEFTNGSFVSAGTNFEGGLANRYASRYYSFPVPAGVTEMVSVRDLDISQAIKDYCGQGTVCDMRFVSSANQRGEVRARAATLSIFADEIDRYNVSSLTGDSNPYFSLNRFNFGAAHADLIPRAVAYSAGLLNYFFRGQMQISLPDAGIYSVVDHALFMPTTTGDPATTTAPTDAATGFKGFAKIKLKLLNTTGPLPPAGVASGTQTMANGTLVAIVKFHAGARHLFLVHFVQGTDGVWRLESM